MRLSVGVMDERHMKYQQYLERLALRRGTDNPPDKTNEWHTVRRKPLGLSAVSHERVVASADSGVKGTQECGNQRFSEEFLSFEN